MDINKDLIAASSTPIVLAILAEEDSYGYAILKRVRELSAGAWSGRTGCSTRSASARAARPRRVRSAESGRRRKYYRITPGGWAQLAEERRQWQAVDATLRASGGRSTFPSRPATRRQPCLCHRESERCRIKGTRYRSSSRSTDGGATRRRQAIHSVDVAELETTCASR